MDTTQSGGDLNCSMDLDASSSSSSANVTRELTSPRLQRKIDVVQQILTLLEQTMATGKSKYEEKVSSIQRSIENFQRSIDALKGQLVNSEANFSQFSTAVGGEINKFCALDNILRTVEESRTENDVKILLPDVSKIDNFVQLYATNKTEDWGRLKEEIVRLNSESQTEEPVVRCITLKVTLKNRILNGAQSNRVNELASIINEVRGKSLNRFYQSNEVPEYSTKYLKITWNQKNTVAAETVTSNTIKIVREAFYDEGEVVKIQVANAEETIQAVNDFQNVTQSTSSAVPQEEGQRRENFTPKNILLYCVGQPTEPNKKEQPTIITTLNLKNSSVANNTNDEIEIVKEVTRATRIRVHPQIEENSDTSTLNAIPHNETPKKTASPLVNGAGHSRNNMSNGQLSDTQTLQSQSSSTVEQTVQSTSSTVNNSSTFSNSTSSTNIMAIRVPVITNNRSENVIGSEGGVSSTTLSSTDPTIIPEISQNHASCDPSVAALPVATDNKSANKAANRYANSRIRKLLAVTLTLNKYGHQPQSSSSIQNTQDSRTILVPTDVSSSSSNSASTSIPVEIDNQSNPQSNKYEEEKENAENLDGVCLKEDLIRECCENGISLLKDVQKDYLPVFIEGRDIICRADKGSGKTTAISLSALQKVNGDILKPQVLVAASSFIRTEKMVEMINNLGKGLKVICRNADELTAGSSSRSHSSSYMEFFRTPNSHILVGVPASLLQLLEVQKFQNQSVICLMLDDLDEIFALGLKSTILKIVYALNASIQLVVMTKNLAKVEEFRRNLRDPVCINQPEKEIPDSPQKKPVSRRLFTQHPVDETDKSCSPINDSPMEYEYTPASSPPSSTDTVVVLHEEDDDVFGIGSDNPETDLESDDGIESSSISSSPEEEGEADVDDFRSITSISRRSSEEIEILVCADEKFAADEKIMTLIPEYIYQSLGVPMMSDYGNDSEVREGASHFYAVLYEDILKIETLSLLDIDDEKTVIFCNSIEKVEALSSTLRQRNLWTQTMHENMSRSEWTAVLRNFARGVCKLLVATDFLTELTTQWASLIINYEFPHPPRNYVSRASFAERCVSNPEYSGTRDPMVVSFIIKNQLKDIQDLKQTFDLRVTPMSND